MIKANNSKWIIFDGLPESAKSLFDKADIIRDCRTKRVLAFRKSVAASLNGGNNGQRTAFVAAIAEPSAASRPLGGMRTDWATGARGLANNLLRRHQVSEEVLQQRLEICNACEHHTSDGALGRCKQCRCLYKQKIKLAYERCPIGKWEAVKEQ